MKIDFLYNPKCPHTEETLQNLVTALKKNGWPAGIHSVQIKDLNQAKRAHFLGSPTIRINGHDLQENASPSERYSLDCRTFLIDGKPASVPTVDFLEEAIRKIVGESDTGKN
ncbi:MAG: DUF2703 domain-containing protein [Calditrichaeota bacterium]|nr:DUF2703 domain-containing protein [Calditrichota bacterium]